MNKQFDENARTARAVNVMVTDALDAKIFTVRGSKGDASYTVDLNDGKVSCTCPDYVYRCAPLGESCKHIIACRQKTTSFETVRQIHLRKQANFTGVSS